MNSWSRLIIGLLFAALLVGACQPIQTPGPEQILSEPDGLHADTPSYGVRGPFEVGYTPVVIDEGADRQLDAGLWYPAINSTGEKEGVVYEFEFKDATWLPDTQPVVYGEALLDADFDDSSGPYPLVIFSHGYSLNGAWYHTFPEHFASHGFVVLAPEHMDPEWMEGGTAAIERPRDIIQTLDYAEQLTAPGGQLAGQIDMENVAVVGHSYGGYTALAMAGAQFDFDALNARCGELAADDPKMFLCMPLLGKEAEMAAQAGLESVPEGLWPSFGDPRVTAIVPMAGDAFLFDAAGLAKITIPMMAIGGTADTGTPWEWGSRPTYDFAASAQKALVGLAGAEHMIVGAPCEDMPWITSFPFYEMMCFDPVWEKERALDLIHHFSTAFLLDTLKGDGNAHAALLPDAVVFPGVEYATTLK